MANPAAQYLGNRSAQIGMAVAATCLIALSWFFLPVPEAPLIASLGAAALIVAIKRPIVVAAIFVCLSSFRIHEVYPILYPLRLPQLFAGLTIVALAWHVSLTRSLRPFWPLELRALAVFFIIATLGIAFAHSSALAWASWVSAFSKLVLMTLVIAWLLREPRDFELATGVMIFSGVLVALVAIQNKYGGVGLVDLTRVTIGRDFQSILGDPNDLALILLIPLSFALAAVVHPSGAASRALALLAFPVILLAIIFTQSRGGLLGVLAVLAMFSLRLKSKPVICLLLVAGAFGLYHAMDISGRISPSYVSSGIDESVQERLRAWQGALDMALARPLTGVGMANFPTSLPQYRPGKELTAHSTWLGVLGETGVPGFIAFMVMMGATVRSTLRARRMVALVGTPQAVRLFATGISGAVAGLCIAGSFLTLGLSWPLYIIVGLAAALSEYVNRMPAITQPQKQSIA